MDVFLACMPVHWVYLVPNEVQKREKDSLELESRMVMRCHMGAGNQTQVLGKNSQCSELLSHLSNLFSSFFKILSSISGYPQTPYVVKLDLNS